MNCSRYRTAWEAEFAADLGLPSDTDQNKQQSVQLTGRGQTAILLTSGGSEGEGLITMNAELMFVDKNFSYALKLSMNLSLPLSRRAVHFPPPLPSPVPLNTTYLCCCKLYCRLA